MATPARDPGVEMRDLRYTLLTDGASDRALLRILTWVLVEHLPDWAIQPEWADLRLLPHPPRDLVGKINAAVAQYPCDLLFVHRDAETVRREQRVKEIQEAKARCANPELLSICVVPVRMTEAWLLFDEQAIRYAAGNPSGTVPLAVPSDSFESIPDPKAVLHELLLTASELTGRRKKRFQPEQCVHQVAGRIEDFSPLRRLRAFLAMEHELVSIIREKGW